MSLNPFLLPIVIRLKFVCFYSFCDKERGRVILAVYHSSTWSGFVCCMNTAPPDRLSSWLGHCSPLPFQVDTLIKNREEQALQKQEGQCEFGYLPIFDLNLCG